MSSSTPKRLQLDPDECKTCEKCRAAFRVWNNGERRLRCPSCGMVLDGRRGRPPKPRRCVVQLRVRSGGKVTSFWSFTLAMEPGPAMKVLQEAFEGHIIH